MSSREDATTTSRLIWVRTLYAYGAWANRRVLDIASALTAAELDAPGDGAYGTPRETLVHTMSAQRLWLARWREEPRPAPLDPSDFADVPAIRAAWDEIEAATRAFVEALTDDDLDRVIAYVNSRAERWAYPLWQQMLHQANHATQHRSEVAALLTRSGRSPGDLDILVYFDQSRQRGG